MMRPPEHPHQVARLEALEAYGILDTPTSNSFDEITALMSTVCQTPIALITLVDRDRQWFLSEKGLGVRSTPLESSVCAHAILQDGFFEVRDLRADPRFADNPLVARGRRIRFYAGAVLRDPTGLPMGSVCVIDYMKRALDAQQRRTLRVLARRVMREIELCRVAREANDLAAQLAVAASSRRTMLNALSRDLRAPLNTISLCTGLMAGGAIDDARRAACVQELGGAAQAMTALVNDLLDVSTLEDAPIMLRPSTVDVGLLIGEAARKAHARQADVAQTLHTDIAVDLGNALWDGGRISQLIEYLVAGAFAASGPQGDVSVGVDADDAQVVIRVADAGDLISPSHLASLFEAFAAGIPAGVRGGGPRLAIVRGIVDAHEGTISPSSVAGSTRMTIVLPRTPWACERVIRST